MFQFCCLYHLDSGRPSFTDGDQHLIDLNARILMMSNALRKEQHKALSALTMSRLFLNVCSDFRRTVAR